MLQDNGHFCPKDLVITDTYCLLLIHSARLQVLWVAADGGEAVWLHATTSGALPGRRTFHTADAFNGEQPLL